jgi:hypothetical protein
MVPDPGSRLSSDREQEIPHANTCRALHMAKPERSLDRVTTRPT